MAGKPSASGAATGNISHHSSSNSVTRAGDGRHLNVPADVGAALRLGSHEYRVGLYGWRKRCLYILLLLLLIVVFVNLALTLFIIRVLDISPVALGGLQIVHGGLVANGEVHIMDALVTSRISSRPHIPVTVLGAFNVTVAAVDSEGHFRSSFLLDKESVQIRTDRFVVRDTTGKLLLGATRDKVEIGSRTLSASGEGGVVFNGSIQTTLVSAPVGEDLLLESVTGSLEVVAPQGVALESRAGTISASCLNDLTLQSRGGVIKLDTPQIFVRGLPTSTEQGDDPKQLRPEVYQMCVCSSGRLFLAPPTGVCAANHDFCK